MSEKAAQKGLGRWALVWCATGQVIGAGVISITGAAVALTGRSAWLAYAVAVAIGLIRILPEIFFSSIMVLRGGKYGIVTRTLGKKWGGVMTLSNLLGWSARGVAVLSMGQYIHSVFPEVSVVMGGAISWTVIYIVNILGINIMAGVQSLMTPLLLAALAMFSFFGFSHCTPDVFNFASPDFFTNGSSGFWAAVVLLCYSTNGQAMISALSERCENPKKDLPFAMIFATGIILVVYCSVSFVAGGVLPVAEIAGQPLTPTAKLVLPPMLFVAFMIGGPIMALATTMNSGIPNNAMPVVAGVEEGWMPPFLAKQNKNRTPYVAYTIIFIIGLIPILPGVSIGQITSFVILLSSFTNFLLIACAYRMPTKFPQEWKESHLHINDVLYYALITLFALFQIYIVYKSVINLTRNMLIINILSFVFVFAYGYYRLKSGKVVMK